MEGAIRFWFAGANDMCGNSVAESRLGLRSSSCGAAARGLIINNPAPIGSVAPGEKRKKKI